MFIVLPNAYKFRPSKKLVDNFLFGHVFSYTPHTAYQMLLKHNLKIVKFEDNHVFSDLKIVATDVLSKEGAIERSRFREGSNIALLKIRLMNHGFIFYQYKIKIKSIFKIFMIKAKRCSLCGSLDINDFYHGVDEYFSKKEVNFMVCRKCSLVFLNPRPSQDEYSKMYKSIFQDKRRNLKSVKEAVNRLESKGSYKNKTKYLKYFKPFVNENSRCLEIGAGWGTLSKVVKDSFACNIEVIEISELAVKTAKEFYGLNVFKGSFDDYYEQMKSDKKFDFIFSFHVFEHILEPNNFLKKLKNLLNKDGKLLLAVPDVTNPDQPNERFFHIEHCYYFSPKTLSLFLNKHGFKVDELYKDEMDFKIVCSLDKDISKNINYDNREIKNIKYTLFFYNLKFKILRFFKKIVFVFISKERQKKISAFMARIMRKLKIIKI